MIFLRFLIIFSVFCRYGAEMSLEAFVKIGWILEAHFVGNLADIHPAFKYQLARNSHALAHDVLVWRHTCDIPHLTVELGVSHLHERGQTFNVEVGIGEMLSYVAVYILAEVLVGHGRNDRCLFRVVRNCLSLLSVICPSY